MQWAKNGFVFLPMFFGGQILNPVCWQNAVLACVAFSLISSAIYCLNDLIDAGQDRLHPKKCKRPIASGAVRPWQAISIMTGLTLCSLALTAFCFGQDGAKATLIILIYGAMQIAYCFKLKRLIIIDVFTIATGFVLRLVLGGIVCGIWLSPWIVSMTFLIALFLAFAKRRDDYILWKNEGVAPRRTVTRYNIDFLNQTLGILASITIVCYLLYSVSTEVEARFNCRYVYISTPFVLAGILRYMQQTMVDSMSGSPTQILYSDRFIHCCLAGWILTFVFIIYL